MMCMYVSSSPIGLQCTLREYHTCKYIHVFVCVYVCVCLFVCRHVTTEDVYVLMSSLVVVRFLRWFVRCV